MKTELSNGVFLTFLESVRRLEIALRCSKHYSEFLNWTHDLINTISSHGRLSDIGVEIFRWGLQMNETNTVQKALSLYRKGLTKTSIYYGVALEGAIRFGPKSYFHEMFSKEILNPYEIMALAAVDDMELQIELIYRFHTQIHYIGLIVPQMLGYGSFESVWQFWKTRPLPFGQLELLVVQLNQSQLEEVKNWRGVYHGVDIGLERVSARHNLC